MTIPYHFLTPQHWKDYELIDSGNFEKLERFGEFILCRPEPQAIWDKTLPEKEWMSLWSAKYEREKGKNQIVMTSEKGHWIKKPKMKDRWVMHYKSPHLDLNFNLSLTSFGHIGVFPEQAVNWEFIFENVNTINKPKVLNLFAYTGASTLAACAAGAEVVHVDSVKQVVNWANENKQLSHLQGIIRWVVEDALKFVKREVKRGNRYNGIILDPPAYGRGPEGEKWLLDQHLNELIKCCSDLIRSDKYFFLLNVYSIGFSALTIDTLISEYFSNINREIGELVLTSKSNQNLPLGTYVRFRS